MDSSTVFCLVCLVLVLHMLHRSESVIVTTCSSAKLVGMSTTPVTTTTNEQHCTMHRMMDTFQNESYVVSATVSSSRVLFMLDTAYAGAPVLSGHYLALIRKGRIGTGTVHE